MAAQATPSDPGPIKRRPMSAPKSSELAAIPRIVLDDPGGAGDPSDPNDSTASITINGPGRPDSGDSGGGGGRSADSPEPRDYVPHRCNSDIGLPTASMPNLTLAMTLGDNGGGSGDTLGVYCSPRTTRRSVDLDVVVGSSSRNHSARQDYEWLEDKTCSLRVLSADSRVGSAVSLNSVCTAHSVGLLSNDSDDDYQETSLHDGSVTSGGEGIGVPGGLGVGPQASSQNERAGQLRRLQSYPEEEKGGGDSGVTPRTSHSLCNLKAVQAPAVGGEGQGPGQGQGQGRGQLTPEKLCLLPSDLDDSEDRVLPPGESGGEKKDGKQRTAKREGGQADPASKSHMVSYGKTPNSMREGRIRRWLQDMDKNSE